MTDPVKPAAGPRELVIAAVICAVLLLGLFGGYQLGKDRAERDNRVAAQS